MKMGELMENKLRGISIPNNWSTIPLYEVRDKSDRYSFTGGPFGSDLKSDDYTDEGVQIIQLQNIGDGFFNNNYKIYTSEEKADSLVSCNIFPGEIIIAKMAEPLARACKIPNHAVRFLMASDGIRLKVDTNKFDNDFVLYSINSKYFRNEAISKGSGSTRLRIGLSELKKIELFYPPLMEQKKISTIISTWDKAIELKEMLIEQKEEQKKGLMQKLLTGEIEIPGINKEDYKVYKLNEIMKIRHGKDQKKVQKENGKYPILGTGGVIGRTDDYLYDKESVLIGRKGTIDRPFYMNTPFWTVDTLFYSEIKDGFLPKYIYYLFNSIPWKNYNEATGVPSLSASTIGTIKVVLPNLEVQKKVAEILTKADEEIELLKEEVQQINLQKKSLMQQLLTGKIRVKV